MKQNAPLTLLMLKEYHKLMALLCQLPPKLRTKKLIQGTGGMISAADLIAYQIGWINLLIGWYEAGLAHRVPDMPGEGFKTWDYAGLAKHFYKKYRLDAAQEQEKKLEQLVKRVVEIIDTEFVSGNLDTLGVWKWCTLASGKQWPLSKWIQINTIAPFKRAQQLMKKMIKTTQ